MNFVNRSQILSRLARLALGLSLSLSLAGATAAEAATYKGQDVRVIDLHMHPGTFDSLGPLGRAFLLDRIPDFIPPFLKTWSMRTIASLIQNPYGPWVGIGAECDKAGIDICGLFATHAPETWGVVSNDDIIVYLEDARNRNEKTGEPRFFGLASTDILEWDTKEAELLAELDRSLDHPLIKGIKMAFIHNNIPLDDPKYDSIYVLAERRGVPVYHHVGSSPLRSLKDFPDEASKKAYIRSFDPAALEGAIARFPNVDFIMGHMGFDFNSEGFTFDEKVYELAAKYPNVYLEISAFGGSYYDEDGRYKDATFKRLKEEGLLERTIYGSDGPGAPGGISRYLNGVLESFERVAYTPDEAEQVLSRTAAKLFGL